MSNAQTPDAKAQENIKSGDDAFAAKKFDNAKSAYNNAYQALYQAHGYASPLLVPVLYKLVDTYYSLNSAGSTSNKTEMCKWLKMALVILQREHGVRSPELIPALEKLVTFYDFDGAHMLATEVLQRIDDIKANLDGGQG